MDERAKTKSIMLFPSEIATFHQIAKDFGLASLSAAVRFVLNDWMRMKKADAKKSDEMEDAIAF